MAIGGVAELTPTRAQASVYIRVMSASIRSLNSRAIVSPYSERSPCNAFTEEAEPDSPPLPELGEGARGEGASSEQPEAPDVTPLRIRAIRLSRSVRK